MWRWQPAGARLALPGVHGPLKEALEIFSFLISPGMTALFPSSPIPLPQCLGKGLKWLIQAYLLGNLQFSEERVTMTGCSSG